MFLLYRNAGMPVDGIDVGYTSGDARLADVDRRIHDALSRVFLVSPVCPDWRWQDGDVLLVAGSQKAGSHWRYNHAGVVVGDYVVTMVGKLRKLSRRLVVPHVYKAYRHRDLI